MANEQVNTNEYTAQPVAETARAAIQTMAVAGTAKAEKAGPRMSGPILTQPTFDWSAKDKYAELRSFKPKVKIMLQNLNISQMESLSIIKNCLPRQGLQLLEILTQAKQEEGNYEEDLSKILNKAFKPQYNETIKSLQL